MYFNDYLNMFLKGKFYSKEKIKNHKIFSFTDDTKKCKTNSVFFAIKGITNDGHQLIDQAINKGATSIICEQIPNNLSPNINYIKVDSTKNAYNQLLLFYANKKLKNMRIIGITGTNGKTTVSTLNYEILKSLNYSVILIGTNGTSLYFGKTKKEIRINTPNTTPKLSIILEIIIKFPQVDYLIMEVSSEALLSNRIDELKFDTVVLTNIGHDHLNSHNTLKEYINAKLKLFSLTKENSTAIINNDDKYAYIFKNYARKKKINIKTFGLTSGELEGEILSINKEYMMVKIYSCNFEYIFGTNLIGQFNLLNILTTLSIIDSEKISINKVLFVFEKNLHILGRYEKHYIKNRNVYIDYAHNPEAIKEFLLLINKIKENKKIITIIGAGGQKDRKKRPKMGEFASFYSDIVIFTEDNSRDEDVKNIIDDLIKGTKKQNYMIEYDRELAIKNAFINSSVDDYLVILGMGNDTYKNKKTDFQMCKEVIIDEQ